MINELKRRVELEPKNYYELEELLQKKSTSMLIGWQKRYYKFMAKGKQLSWYKKEPIDQSSDPSGSLNVENIVQVYQFEQ